MASPIIFRVQDGVDPSIAQNVTAISTAARSADASVQSLTQALQAINNSGVAGLATQLSNASASTTRLSNTTAKMGAAALTASQNVDKLTTSYTSLNTIITTSIATLSSYSAALVKANAGAVSFNQGVNSLNRGAGGATGNFIASSAALNVMEKGLTGNTRAAGRFLTSVLGLGPILQAAFPLFGLLAFVGALGVIYDGIQKLIAAFKNLSVEEANAAVNAIYAGDKILKIKPESTFSLSNVARVIDNNPNTPSNIEIQNVQAKLKEINATKQIADANEVANEKGLQGLALQNAKVTAIENEIQFTIQAKQQVDDLAASYAKLRTQTTVDQTAFRDPTSPTGFNIQTQTNLKITDPTQQKALDVALTDAVGSSKELNTQIAILNANLKGQNNENGLAVIKDNLKQARAQLKGFNADLDQLKTHQNIFDGGDKTTESLNQQLNLLNSEVATALPQNLDALNAKITTVTGELANHKNAVEALNDKYKDQINEVGLYSDALKSQSEFDKAILTLQKSKITLTDQEKNSLRDLITQAVAAQHVQAALKQVYTEFKEPLVDYQAKQQAINELEQKGVITHNQALIALNEAKKSYQDSINPLTEYVHGLQDQIDLFGKFGIAATVASEVQKVQNDLRAKGRTLTDGEKTSLTNYLTAVEQEKEIQTSINALYNSNQGAQDKLTLSIIALTQARNKGIISEKQFSVAISQTAVAMANLNIQMGKFTKGDVLTSITGDFLKDFKGVSVGITTAFGTAFDQIANGAATALGNIFNSTESVGDALRDVARNVLSELLGALIKIGIQAVVNQVTAAASNAASVTQAVITGQAIAAAYANAAALASLATAGANAVGANIGIASVTAETKALEFNSGGIVPGYGNRDNVPALLTPGEGVLTQAATRFFGASTIQSWNKGQFGVTPSGAGSGGSGRPSLMLNLIHDTNAISFVQVNENTVRAIAKQEANNAVAQHAPGVVAAQISKPSSEIRKSLQLHTNVRGAH